VIGVREFKFIIAAEVRDDQVRSRRGLRGLGLLVAVVVIVLLRGGVADAAVTWRVDALSDATVAAGGQLQYLLQLTNVGDSDAPLLEGPTLSVQLPAGVTVAPGGLSGWPFLGAGVCSPSDVLDGLNSFSCSLFHDMPPHAGLVSDEGGTNLQMALTVDVPQNSSGVLTSRFTVTDPAASGPASTMVNTAVSSRPPSFGVAVLDGQVSSDAAGDPLTQAGGHPYSASVSIDFNTETNPNPFIGPLWPVETTKDVVTDLPAGLAGYPPSAAKCTAPELIGPRGGITPESTCPPASQVGTTLVRVNGLGGSDNVFGPIPVYNMVPPSNAPAQFGFNVEGSVVTLTARVRAAANYSLAIDAIDVPEGLPVASTTVTLWGTPADSSHDGERACAGQVQPFAPLGGGPTCTSSAPQAAFVRNPTSCDPPTPGADGVATTAFVDSWENPGPVDADGNPVATDPRWKSATFISHLPPAYPEPASAWGPHQLPTGCVQVPFGPKLVASPRGAAKPGAPTGFNFDLTLPQSDDPKAIGESDLEKAVVTLPVGVRVSPSSASGLGGCSLSQIRLGSDSDVTCPDNAKIGSLTVTTPALDQPLNGSVYLATPNDNPFHSLIAIYLVAKGPGFVLKIPGKTEANPVTGQLTATFDNNPQLPFSDLHLEFNDGPQAPLVTPSQCGTYTTKAVLTSWSGRTVESDSSFDVSADGNGAPCAPAGFSPVMNAGTENSIAGTDSPFDLGLSRTDQDQEFSALAVNTPSGLLGRIANTVLCPDAAANAGTCTDGSKIGDVAVGAGAGINPFYINNGRAYITGPYKGAPYGLSIVVPAVAGPFDLGDVVVRSAIFVDRNTAALKVVSDPLPTILQGIPLNVRDIHVLINRPHFFINPTSCAEKTIIATVASTQGAIAHPTARFQAGDCASLALTPKLSMTVGSRHHTQAGVSTPVTATITMPKGNTNLRSVSVTLPGTLNALLPVVNRACKLTEFQAGKCGNQAKIGTAVAVTPLLRDPLRGSVYFVKNPARILPDLMVALRGQVNLDVTAKIHIPGGKRLATQFDTIPDAPITKFSLRIVSGKNGPVGIATNLCSAKGRAATAAVGYRGQNGAIVQTNQKLRIAGCPKPKKAKKNRSTAR
jgi:hypothetical protein